MIKKLFKKFYILCLISSFAFASKVCALTPEEILEKEAPNGVISFNTVRPNNIEEAEFMALSDWYFRESANEYENYTVVFDWKLVDIKEDGTYEYSVDEGKISIIDQNKNDFNNTVLEKEVNVKYNQGNEKVLKEVNKSLKVFDKINFTEDDYLTLGYRINDLALVNYYYYNEKETFENSNTVGNIVKYSPEFIKDTEGNGFKYKIDCRAGDGGSFELWGACFGGMTLYYDNMVYGYHMIGEVEEHTIFVDNSVEDTPEATIKSIKERIKKYLGIDVTVEYQGTIEQLKNNVFEEAIQEYNTQLEQGITLYSEDGTAEGYATSVVSNLFHDRVRKESETDGRYYKMTLNGYDMYFLVVKTDLSKIEVPTYLGKDILTDIEVKTSSTSIPLDTSVNANEITEGEEYSKIKKALGNNANFKTYDIKLFSDNNNSYITKINDDEFEVKMPIPDNFKGKQLKVFYVDLENNVEEHVAKVEGDYLVFKTNHFSAYSISYEEQNTVLEDTEPVPETSDNLTKWITIEVFSIIGILIGLKCKRKEV